MNSNIESKWSRFSKFFYTDKNNEFNIVYFHAFTGSFKNKSHLVTKFKNCNFYAFDMPGHGNTQLLSESEISIDNFCKLAVDFIIDFDINNIILMGHSMGGGIVNLIANNSLIEKRIKKIILECPASNASLVNYDSIICKLIPNDLSEMEIIGKELFYDPIKFFGNERYYNKFLSLEFQRLKDKKYLKVILDKNSQSQFGLNINKAIATNSKPALLILGEQDNIIPAKESIEIFSINKLFFPFVIKNSKHVPVAECTDVALTEINNFILK